LAQCRPVNIGSNLVCCVPKVCEFSTAVARFQNQITRQVLLDLSKRCQAVVPPVPPGPVILSETTTVVPLSFTLSFILPADEVLSVETAIQNVAFEIIGFGSVIVRVSGDIVITVTFLGTDGLNHTQTQSFPFSTVINVPGTFPTNIAVAGDVALANQVIVQEFDPSTLAVTAVTDNITLTITIRILTTA
jgi:hypothetical protein